MPKCQILSGWLISKVSSIITNEYKCNIIERANILYLFVYLRYAMETTLNHQAYGQDKFVYWNVDKIADTTVTKWIKNIIMVNGARICFLYEVCL